MALPISNWLSLLANMNNEVFRCPETRKWRSYLFDERIGDGDYPSMETGCYKTLWGVYGPPWPKTTAPHNATLSDVFRLFWGPRTLVQKVKNLCQTFKEFPFILTYSTYIYIYIYLYCNINRCTLFLSSTKSNGRKVVPDAFGLQDRRNAGKMALLGRSLDFTWVYLRMNSG